MVMEGDSGRKGAPDEEGVNANGQKELGSERREMVTKGPMEEEKGEQSPQQGGTTVSMKQVCEKWGVRRSEARSRGVLVKEGNREVPISRARKGTLEALAGDLGVVPLVRQALLPRLKVVLEGVLAEQATQESREDPGGA